MKVKPEELRSHRWFGAQDLRSFGHRSRIKQMGYSEEDFQGKPIIGIINTGNDISPCHFHFKQRAEEIKRGVLQAGGFPLELPAIGLAENFQKPTTMLYRNLLAMETEEMLRSYPIDGAILMGGCDKTLPALIMGGVSAGLPMIAFPSGPMMRGCWKGKTLGSGSDTWKYWDELRAGNISDCDWRDIEGGIARTAGHCMTMGTASTVTTMTEALGLTLPGASSIPAVMADHARLAASTGRMAVEIVEEDRRPNQIITQSAVHNAMVTTLALGGSTNAVVHLVAIARRAGFNVGPESFNSMAHKVPLLANVRPAGKYLMEDFHDAGGSRALLKQLGSLLELEAETINGQTLGVNVGDAEVIEPDVITSLDSPISTLPALRVLKGNLSPDGALIKPTSMDPTKLRHRGPALVFDSYRELKRQIDDPDLDIDESTVLVMRGAGPVGGPGMPEWGMMPIPTKLLKRGIRDLVRISDARMSGTSYGTCILHVTPESAVGGPLGALRTGDIIELDVEAGSLNAIVEREEWDARLAELKPVIYPEDRGYTKLYRAHVQQADTGCDFDFLSGTTLTEPEIL